jgi:hypothetical protein
MAKVQLMSDYFYPSLQRVKALEPWVIRTTWSTDEELDVDLSIIFKRKAFADIRQPEVFKKVRLHKGCIEWLDTELGADNVYAWAKEQSGEVSHEMFAAWMARNSLSLSTAAAALGISRRMVSYYRTATKPIPRAIWLACLGWEITKPTHALPRELPSTREYAALRAA